MAWDDTPPTQQEVEALSAGSKQSSWADAPPSHEELKSLGVQPKSDRQQRSDDRMQTIKDMATGGGDTFGLSQQVGGLAEAIPNNIQSVLHSLGLTNASPTQVNAGLKAMGFTGDIGPTSTPEMYKEGSKDTLKAQDEAVARSPIAYRAGEVGGLGLGALGAGMAGKAIKAGLGLGAAAETANAASKVNPGLLARLGKGAVAGAPVGAAYGAANSKGSVIGGTPEEQQQVLKDAETGGLLGGVLGGAGRGIVGDSAIKNAAGDITSSATGLKGGLSKLGDLPMMKQLQHAFSEGQKGIDMGSEKAQVGELSNPESINSAYAMHDTKAAARMTDEIHQMDDMLGKDVGSALDKGDASGIVLKARPEIISRLDDLSELPALAEKPSISDKLTRKGELAVEKERMLGNDASYEVTPSEDSQGRKIQNLTVRKGGPEDGNVEKILPPDPEAVAQQSNPELTSPKDDNIRLRNEYNPDKDTSNSASVSNAYENEQSKDGSIQNLINKFKTDGLSPREMWSLRRQLGDIGTAYKKSTDGNQQLQAAQIFNVVNQLNGQLKQTVPSYGHAAERMAQFRSMIPETILSKSLPSDISGIRMSSTRNVSKKLTEGIKKIIQGLNTGDVDAKARFQNFLQGLSQLDQSEQARKASGQISQTIFDRMGFQPQDIVKDIQQSAAKSSMIQPFLKGSNNGLPPTSLNGIAKAAAKAPAVIANKAGLVTKAVSESPVVSTANKLYNSSNETLQNFSDNTLSKIPGQKGLSESLNKALKANDSTAKNAVLFTIMQTPNLRSLVESNDLDVQPK